MNRDKTKCAKCNKTMTEDNWDFCKVSFDWGATGKKVLLCRECYYEFKKSCGQASKQESPEFRDNFKDYLKTLPKHK